MKIVIAFKNIGFYHLARIKAIVTELSPSESLYILEITKNQGEHPWGQHNSKGIKHFFTLPRGKFKKYLTLVNYLISTQPDVICIPGWSSVASIILIVWAKMHSSKTIVFSETKFEDKKRIDFVERLKSKLITKSFDAAIVGGVCHKDYLMKMGMKSTSIFLGYDVVDNKHFSKSTELKIIPQNNPFKYKYKKTNQYFIGVGRFIDIKNYGTLIKAFAQYRIKIGSNDAWHLVLCGSGPLQSELSRLVDIYELSSCVHFPGFVKYEEMPLWYLNASAFVHPAYIEPWGLVVNEACAAGLPIVVSVQTGATPDLCHHMENGFTFYYDDIDALASYLVRLHYLSDQKRHEMGMQSLKLVERLSPTFFANNFTECLRYVNS